MGNKSGNTTTTSSTSSADPQAAQTYRDLLARASGVAATPYQAYSGDLTAPVNSQQQAGISGINANAGFASPFIQNASNQAASASSPLTAGQIQSYLNPYTQNVVDATNAQMTHDNGVAMAGLQGNQISQGALGGNATGVAKGILAGQNARTMASTDANLYSQGYGQAVQTAQGQQQLGLAGANAQANYGISGQNALLAGAGQQINAGSLEQQTQQANLNALYGQYQQAQAYPYQQTQWLAGIDTGVGSNLGGSSTGSTTAPPPNPWAQALGLGVAAAGTAAKFAAHGGRINRFSGGGVAGPFMRMADGGVPGTPWSGGVGWIPTMAIHGGSGAPHGGAPSAPQTPAFDAAKFASGISGISSGTKGASISDAFGSYTNPDAYGTTFTGGVGAYGGSSSNPLPGLDPSDYGEGYAAGGGVDDADQSYNSPYQIRTNGGQHQVINIQTGQVHYTGTASGAANAQATLNSRRYAFGGGVAGYAGGGAPAFAVLTNGDPAWEDPDVGPGYPRAAARVPADVMNGDPGWDHPDVGLGVGATFADRFGNMPPAQKNLPFQDSYFAANGVDPKSFAGDRTAPPAKAPPVVANDDDEEELPPAATPTQGGPQGVAGGAYKPPYQITAQDAPAAGEPRRGLFGISDNASTGMITAGLGMLASRSPNFGNAVGEGGLAGLSAYGSAEAQDQKVAAEARKLSLEAKKQANADYHTQFTSEETARHNRATEAKEFKPQLIHRPNPSTGQEEYGTFDPNTRTIKPLAFPSSGDAKAGEKFVSEAPPVEERRKALPASPQARDEGYLKWLDQRRPPGYADVVRGVADYEMDPNRIESLQKGQRSQLYRDAKLYDPTYDQTHFKEKNDTIASFARGSDRAAVNSLNVGISHLGTLQNLGDALNNGQWPIINNVLNRAGIMAGRPEVTNFNAAKEIVGDEVVKAIVGGVNSQADREAIKHLIMAQQSPAQLKGTIDTFITLMGGQLEGRRTGYQAGTGLNNFDLKYLSPETRDAMNRVKAGGPLAPEIVKAVYPSGIPQPNVAPVAAPGASGFRPPAGALARQYQGKTYYYDPATRQPYPGQ